MLLDMVGLTAKKNNRMQQMSGGGNKQSAATKIQDCTIEEASKKLVKIKELWTKYIF